MLNQTHSSFTQHCPPLWYEGLAKRGVTWRPWQPFPMAVSLPFSPVAQASNSLVISFPFPTHRDTHMAMLIQLIVGEFDFFEGHHLLQQLLSCEWGVRVHIQPKKHRENACSLKNLTSGLVCGHDLCMKLKCIYHFAFGICSGFTDMDFLRA